MNQVEGNPVLPAHAPGFTAPLISLVITSWNTDQQLAGFLKQLEEQGKSLENVEVIFIGDDSRGTGLQLASQWLSDNKTKGAAISFDQSESASGRNYGLAQARGKWVSFPDPADILHAGYLDEVIAVLTKSANDDASLIATRIGQFDEKNQTISLDHPLDYTFRQNSQSVSLNDDPQYLKLSTGSAFLKLEVIRDKGLQFNPQIKPDWNETDFLSRYLLEFEEPKVAFLKNALYLVRMNNAQNSLNTSSWTQVEKYLEIPKHGWLRLLADAQAKKGAAPAWIQHTVLHEIFTYFQIDNRVFTPTRMFQGEIGKTFLSSVSECLEFINEDSILNQLTPTLGLEAIVAILALKKNLNKSTLPLDTLQIHPTRTNSFKVTYYFNGSQPEEKIGVGNQEIKPTHSKVRAVMYFGHTVVNQRILWFKSDEKINATIAGQAITIESNDRDLAVSKLAKALRAIREEFEGNKKKAPVVQLSRTKAFLRLTPRIYRRLQNEVISQAEKLQARNIKSKANRPTVRDKYADAWVFMDQDTHAHDNAEHFYRWVRHNAPEINAWFVLRKSASEWERLQANGFNLCDFGSREHKLLLLNAKVLLSSHIDNYVVNPLNQKLYGPNRWSFAYLQHGVLKDDLSRWFNPKNIDLFTTAAFAEHKSIVADGTPYKFTTKEVKLTGFPRHDVLLKSAESLPNSDRNLIAIVPTWRFYLLSASTGKGNSRRATEDFKNSRYIRQWIEFLNSNELRSAAEESGKEIVFAPHPNMAPHIEKNDIPDHVGYVRHSEVDSIELLSRACVAITDYSSVILDCAFLKTPVVYFQFDRDEYFANHPHRLGYFDYEEHGFGPVATTVANAVEATVRAALNPDAVPARYLERATDFFPARDGGASERVFRAIKELLEMS